LYANSVVVASGAPYTQHRPHHVAEDVGVAAGLLSELVRDLGVLLLGGDIEAVS
jgi:hypothetical protein